MREGELEGLPPNHPATANQVSATLSPNKQMLSVRNTLTSLDRCLAAAPPVTSRVLGVVVGGRAACWLALAQVAEAFGHSTEIEGRRGLALILARTLALIMRLI